MTTVAAIGKAAGKFRSSLLQRKKVKRFPLDNTEQRTAVEVWKMHIGSRGTVTSLDELYHMLEALQIPLQPLMRTLVEESFHEKKSHFALLDLVELLEQCKTLHRRWLFKVRGKRLEDDLLEAFVAIGAQDDHGEVEMSRMKAITSDFNLDLDFSQVNPPPPPPPQPAADKDAYQPPEAAKLKTNQPGSPTAENKDRPIGFHMFVDLLREEDVLSDGGDSDDGESPNRDLDNLSFTSGDAALPRLKSPKVVKRSGMISPSASPTNKAGEGDDNFVMLSNMLELAEEDLDAGYQQRQRDQQANLNNSTSDHHGHHHHHGGHHQGRRQSQAGGSLLPPIHPSSSTPQPHSGTNNNSSNAAADRNERSHTSMGLESSLNNKSGGTRRNRFATGRSESPRKNKKKPGHLPGLSPDKKKPKKHKFET